MLSGWKLYRKITIDHTKFDTDQATYPLLILISSASGIGDVDLSSIFTELGANSLKFAIGTATDTECYAEVVSWDNPTLSEVWSDVGAVSSAADTVVYIYYDSGHADNSTYVGTVGSTAGKLVWDSSFAEVVHGNDGADTSHITGSVTGTSYSKKGATEPAVANGIIGKAQSFDGSNDYIDLTNSASFNPTTAMTIEACVNITNIGYLDEWILGRDKSGARAYAFGKEHNKNDLWVQINGTAQDDETCVTAGSNQYVVTEGSTDIGWDIYNNGSQVGSGGAWSAPASVSENTYIGRRGYSGYEGYFKGLIDELRISNIARSAAYIKANNSNFTDELVTFGAEEFNGTYLIRIPHILTKADMARTSTIVHI